MINELANLKVDDSTTHITIATPKGWKCKRPGCKVDYKHGHSTYSQLNNPNERQRQA